MWRFFLCVWLLAVPGLGFAAVNCDGVDDVLTTGTNLSSFLNTTNSTIMIWVRADAATAAAACHDGEGFVGGTGGSAGIGTMTESATQKMCAYHDDGGGDRARFDYTLGTPIHVTWSHTTTLIRLYLDAVNVHQLTSNASASLATPLVMCRFGTGFGQGVIDRVEIYNSLLAADEIANAAGDRKHKLRRSQPTAVWDFGECGDGGDCNAVSFRDGSGNGRTATGDNGANNTGLSGSASQTLSYLPRRVR